MFRSARTVSVALIAALVAGGLIWALLPARVRVDLVAVRRGPMQVTVSAEGITRVRDTWLVTAPVTGEARRSPVHVGDAVTAGETVVAAIEPAEPPFLDARARRLAEAAVVEAEAAVRLAGASLFRAETELMHFEAELDRARALTDRGTLAQAMLEDAEQAALSARAARDVAQSDLDMRRATLARMEAQLEGPETLAFDGSADCCVEITAPRTGVVLDLVDESARLVTAGETLLMIGDPEDLEIHVDLLSNDAIGVVLGTRARVERWGGDTVLDAEVRQIEPSAFTRVSALGIEEQRVPVVLDILSPATERVGLGDRYRVYVTLVTWEGKDVLQVPQSALFRSAGEWALFVEEDGRAAQRSVKVGHMSSDWAEIVSGVPEGARVIAYPGSSIEDGTRIEPRETAAEAS
ncbi:efflux RND transporter periplasmic adaptor subunit [Jannaschia seohaensis]|uniref:HlyD family secretion protein n=1 Tax=Jannaschia seohaensis TaxID=475081 RepID=A0A2Y9AJM9_9RHOB|nr:HlyD family efflux transporter periplasmic adaptor subunit [Jannaschia seohaensis]PWJ20615.1 HlyD family secretion protein [Jannaschia seohaensis]SSA44711.1 HlyD family secretion protein [Jannaschia seohaensis]